MNDLIPCVCLEFSPEMEALMRIQFSCCPLCQGKMACTKAVALKFAVKFLKNYIENQSKRAGEEAMTAHLLSRVKAAELIGISDRQFRKYVDQGRLDPVIFEGGHNEKHFYKREDCLKLKTEIDGGELDHEALR